jgi:hypothetical protein
MCMSDSDCLHGVCVDQKCACVLYWKGDLCQTSWSSDRGWLAFFIIYCIVASIVYILCFFFGVFLLRKASLKNSIWKVNLKNSVLWVDVTACARTSCYKRVCIGDYGGLLLPSVTTYIHQLGLLIVAFLLRIIGMVCLSL